MSNAIYIRRVIERGLEGVSPLPKFSIFQGAQPPFDDSVSLTSYHKTDITTKGALICKTFSSHLTMY